jgi:hypothetical protein
MIDYLTYYYKLGTEPFRSLSALSDEEAIKIMKELYSETVFGERFQNPKQYLHNRRETEKWVCNEFKKKGGQPQHTYPIPMVLGTSRWMAKNSPDPDLHGEIRIPLSVFSEYDVSFTYPDSMISLWFAREKPKKYYMADYHGKVFTLSEILSIIREKGIPEDDWHQNLPNSLAPYIEAQVWNHKILEEFK